ncbi:MAG: hypothetical protein ABR985_01480 [Methanotrichaceae archaeon]
MQLIVDVPKHLNISLKIDALVDEHIVLLASGKFQYQMKMLQEAGSVLADQIRSTGCASMTLCFFRA